MELRLNNHNLDAQAPAGPLTMRTLVEAVLRSLDNSSVLSEVRLNGTPEPLWKWAADEELEPTAVVEFSTSPWRKFTRREAEKMIPQVEEFRNSCQTLRETFPPSSELQAEIVSFTQMLSTWSAVFFLQVPHYEDYRRCFQRDLNEFCSQLSSALSSSEPAQSKVSAALACVEGMGKALAEMAAQKEAFVFRDQVVQQPYEENIEVGARNLTVKRERQREGGVFEWPNIVALNEAVSSLVRPAKRIVNIGAGTGSFEASLAAASDVEIIASEFDKDCVAWCKEHRSFPNVQYTSYTMEELRALPGEFDLAVSIEVVEHVADYRSFLEELSSLAPRVILTTPNRNRDEAARQAMPPLYYQHVREWTAGEFYWVLRTFFSAVEMFAQEHDHSATTERVGLDTQKSPLIAVCYR